LFFAEEFLTLCSNILNLIINKSKLLSDEMKMITTKRQNSLSLSGGHIVSDSLNLPSYSPNAVSVIAQPFPWDETVDDINTPDIDPSFFDGPDFKKYNTQNSLQQMDAIINEELFLTEVEQTSFTNSDDTNQQSVDYSLEENFDLSQLINQTTADIIVTESSMVSPNDVLEPQYIPVTTSPVLHYLEPRPVEPIASTVNIEFITNTSLIDSLNSQSTIDSYNQFSPSQSYSPSLTSVAQSYVSPTPSPALSYTSTTSQSTLVSAMDGITSDTNTIDSLIETKPEPEFFQPTVINDHLYTRPQSSALKKRKASTENSKARNKNNMASKKSRMSKRDKQKEMDEKIQFYIEDNAKCKKAIEDMEKQILWCKDYLFKKVTKRT